jgi:alpha-beta hydrolase superfamily lysophospholipase
MLRRIAALVAAGALLAGCGGGSRPAARPVAVPSSAPAVSQAPPAGRAPSKSFEIGIRTDTFTRDGTRPLRTTTWYPKASGRYPLVLFSHGLHGDPADFTPLLSRWARAGFVVVAPAYPNTSRNAPKFDLGDVLNQPADASFVLTKTLAGPLSARIDPAQVAATGHSAGGITTVGLFTVGRDERLRAGIVFAGAAIGFAATFAGPAAPLLFVHGDADEVVSYASGKAVYDRDPWPKALLTLPGASHSTPYARESDPAYGTVAASTLDFLRYALYGDPAARGRLAADTRPAGQFDDRL